jgi:DNA-binding CsgD family transcriptional regulator
MQRSILQQVRELLERNLNPVEIADRLCIDPSTVATAIQILTDWMQN